MRCKYAETATFPDVNKWEQFPHFEQWHKGMCDYKKNMKRTIVNTTHQMFFYATLSTTI